MNSKTKNRKKISYGEGDETNLKLVVTLNRCLQALRKRELPVIKEAGLTMPQFGVLELLYHKGSFKINEIIIKTLSTGGNMTVVIDNLVKRGLVERINCDSDRRSQFIELTVKGSKLIQELFPKHIDNLGNVLSVLSRDEKLMMISLAKKLGVSLADISD